MTAFLEINIALRKKGVPQVSEWLVGQFLFRWGMIKIQQVGFGSKTVAICFAKLAEDIGKSADIPEKSAEVPKISAERYEESAKRMNG